VTQRSARPRNRERYQRETVTPQMAGHLGQARYPPMTGYERAATFLMAIQKKMSAGLLEMSSHLPFHSPPLLITIMSYSCYDLAVSHCRTFVRCTSASLYLGFIHQEHHVIITQTSTSKQWMFIQRNCLLRRCDKSLVPWTVISSWPSRPFVEFMLQMREFCK
jgi:hypothetical protein